VAVAPQLRLELDVLDDVRLPDCVVMRHEAPGWDVIPGIARIVELQAAHIASRQVANSRLSKLCSLPPDPNLRHALRGPSPCGSQRAARVSRSASVSSCSTQSAPGATRSPPRKMSPAYIESPRPSSASPQTTSVPSCIMNADM